MRQPSKTVNNMTSQQRYMGGKNLAQKSRELAKRPVKITRRVGIYTFDMHTGEPVGLDLGPTYDQVKSGEVDISDPRSAMYPL